MGREAAQGTSPPGPRVRIEESALPPPADDEPPLSAPPSAPGSPSSEHLLAALSLHPSASPPRVLSPRSALVSPPVSVTGFAAPSARSSSSSGGGGNGNGNGHGALLPTLSRAASGSANSLLSSSLLAPSVLSPRRAVAAAHASAAAAPVADAGVPSSSSSPAFHASSHALPSLPLDAHHEDGRAENEAVPPGALAVPRRPVAPPAWPHAHTPSSLSPHRSATLHTPRSPPAGQSLPVLHPTPASPLTHSARPFRPSPPRGSLETHPLLLLLRRGGGGGGWGGVPPSRLVRGFGAVLIITPVNTAHPTSPGSSPPARFPQLKRRLPFAAELPSHAGGVGIGGGGLHSFPQPPFPHPRPPSSPPLHSHHTRAPYVASIALDGSGLPAGFGGGERLRVPPSGDLTLILSNPEGTPLHAFRLRYDLSSGAGGGLEGVEPRLPVRAHFRQRMGPASAAAASSPRPAALATCVESSVALSPPPPPTGAGLVVPRYAMQVRFAATHAQGRSATRRVFLQGDIRVAFAHRKGDDGGEGEVTESEGPVLEVG